MLLTVCMIALAAVRQMRMGWADWQARPAQSFIDEQLMSTSGGLQDGDRWRDALGRLDSASRLDPQQAGHHLYLGLAYFIRVRGLPVTHALSDLSQPYLEECAFHLRRAISLNPRMGRAHAALAACKGRLAQWDAEFTRTVSAVVAHAPFELHVWYPVLSLTLAAWPQLDTVTREVASELAQRAVRVASSQQRRDLSVWMRQGDVCRLSPRMTLCSVVSEVQP